MIQPGLCLAGMFLRKLLVCPAPLYLVLADCLVLSATVGNWFGKVMCTMGVKSCEWSSSLRARPSWNLQASLHKLRRRLSCIVA